jgi:hypothetical protein
MHAHAATTGSDGSIDARSQTSSDAGRPRDTIEDLRE